MPQDFQKLTGFQNGPNFSSIHHHVYQTKVMAWTARATFEILANLLSSLFFAPTHASPPSDPCQLFFV